MTEPYFEESQKDLTLEEDKEEREYRLRYERRQRMRRERQRRMRRRQMLQRVVFLVIVGVITVLIVATIKHGEKVDEEGAQDQAVEAVEQPDRLEIEKIRESIIEEESGKAETEETESEEELPVYRFEETEDTVSIATEEVISTHAILVDESTDQIIAAKGAGERIMPASMTKVLTILVAAEHIPEEKLDDTFEMTLEITDYAYVNDCSSVGFLDGEKVPVRDLFYGTAMHSGGDAALGLAFYVAGSQEAFVELMDEKLDELGIAGSTHFTNCVGIYDEAHYSTVYDMAVIMKAALQNDLCREVMSKHIYTTKPTKEHPEGIEISNWFLRKIEDKDTGGEVLCAKTGYIVQSKNCAVSYEIAADKTPYICVTAGSTSNWRCIYDHVEIYNRYIPSA
ncbi:MAG: D-alanyl-D-alanine carboxypeptidase [Lachnospiraceae bacterium]|jgi:D-alanyl-D-alanine carboxypeptidase (penicillin-binding protein 5/6)